MKKEDKNLLIPLLIFTVFLILYSNFNTNNQENSKFSTQNAENLNEYVLFNSFLDLNLSKYETYKPGIITIPFNGTDKQFNLESSKRAEYSKNESIAVKVWIEALPVEQYSEYKKAMLEELNSFSKPKNEGVVPLSKPIQKNLSEIEYYYSYKPSTVFGLLCETCWFSSGFAFFDDKNVSVAFSFFKPIGQTHLQAVNNTESFIREFIENN